MTEETPTPENPVPPMSDDDLRVLARDIVMGKVFTDRHIRPNEGNNMLGMIFMPLGLGGLPEGVTPENLGMVYEYIEKCGPRSVNGYPCFFSVRFVRKDQMEKLIGYLKHAQIVLDSLTPQPEGPTS